jgi:hypothetical protein
MQQSLLPPPLLGFLALLAVLQVCACLMRTHMQQSLLPPPLLGFLALLALLQVCACLMRTHMQQSLLPPPLLGFDYSAHRDLVRAILRAY